MKQFSCGDVVPGCSRTFSGTEGEILTAVGEHARTDHGLAEIPHELVRQVRAQIRTAA